MSYSKFVKITIALVAATSLQAAHALKCPTQSNITIDKLDMLAAQGETVIDNQKVRLSTPTSKTEYKGPTGKKLAVLENQHSLSDFLNISKKEMPDAHSKPVSVMGMQNTNEDKNVCEYTVTGGKLTHRMNAVLALASADAPKRPSNPAPQTPGQ